MALSVPLSRFTSRVGGGSAFFVRPHYTFMKITIQILSLALVVGFISGCSTTTVPPSGCSSGKMWYRADASPQELKHDLAQCQYDAILTRRSSSVYGATLGQALVLKMVADSSEESKENQMIAACMAAKGYELVKDTNAPPPAVTGTGRR